MPRTGRLHIPGGCYHLIGRGLEKRHIFEHTIDKQDLLARFGVYLEKTGCQCLAWALMSNHYHFLVRVGAKPLDKLMAPVLGGFAGSYNLRHARNGYVFQNRFTSILCDEENYLLALVRYIHLNPVTAGMVDDLESLAHYPWTGHAGMLNRYCQDWHSTEVVLSHFASTRRNAVRKYLGFMQSGIDSANSDDFLKEGLVRSQGSWESISRFRLEHRMRIGDERILGDAAFIEKVLREDRIGIEIRSRLSRQGWDLERLVTKVCDLFDVDPDDLNRKSRASDLSRAKAMICYLGHVKLGLSHRVIADRLNISQPAVSKWVVKGRKQDLVSQELWGFTE